MTLVVKVISNGSGMVRREPKHRLLRAGAMLMGQEIEDV